MSAREDIEESLSAAKIIADWYKLNRPDVKTLRFSKKIHKAILGNPEVCAEMSPPVEFVGSKVFWSGFEVIS